MNFTELLEHEKISKNIITYFCYPAIFILVFSRFLPYTLAGFYLSLFLYSAITPYPHFAKVTLLFLTAAADSIYLPLYRIRQGPRDTADNSHRETFKI